MPGTNSKRKHEFVIKRTIYPFDIIVLIELSTEEMSKTLKRNKVRVKKKFLEDGPDSGRAILTKDGNVVIIINSFPDTPKRFGILAHEIFHATHFIMNRIGQNLTMDSCEAYSYMIEYITSEIYEKTGLVKRLKAK